MAEPQKTLPLSNPGRFATLVLILVAIVGCAALAWRVSGVLVLIFGSVLLAIVLRAAAGAVRRLSGLSSGWSFALAVTAIIAVLALVLWLAGARFSAEIGQLTQELPKGWSSARTWLEQRDWGRALAGQLESLARSGGARTFMSFVSTTFGGLADALLLVVLALFIGANPELYRKGLLALIPPPATDRVRDALDAAAAALRKWLMGQAIAMVTVGCVTGLGLWLLGVPLALTLGLLAGLFNFVPFVGPIVMALPAVLLAFTQSPELALYTALLYLAVQQLEGNVMQPLVQQWAVSLPPALTLISVVMFGLLFGIVGVIFAAPLMVTVMVLVRKLYVEGALGRR